MTASSLDSCARCCARAQWRTERSATASPGHRRAGSSRHCWPTSTCTGSTGNGSGAGPASWCATPMISSRCAKRAARPRSLAALRAILAEFGLQTKPAKTRIVHLREGGEGLDFLGFHHRWMAARSSRGRQAHSSPAGPHVRRFSTPATASGSSPRAAAAAHGRTSHAGDQHLPARLGGLLPLRKLDPPLRRDQRLRVSRPRPVRRQTPPTRRGLRALARPASGPRRPDQPRRTRHRAQTQPGLAGTAERRRWKTSVSRVRENRMHGSMGGGRKPGQSATPRGIGRLPPTRHNLATRRRAAQRLDTRAHGP